VAVQHPSARLETCGEAVYLESLKFLPMSSLATLHNHDGLDEHGSLCART